MTGRVQTWLLDCAHCKYRLTRRKSCREELFILVTDILSMAAALESLLMTVDQYRQLPLREDVIQELHWGRIVTVTRPKMKHARLQSRLVRLLRPQAEHLGVVESEVAFRALPEYDLRGADVAFVSRQRWDRTPDDDNLQGSPELVIEILSPSNRRGGGNA